MHKILKYQLLLSALFLGLLFFLTCSEKQAEIDFPDIRARGTLIAVTGYNATSYFIYRGQPMGYEYELLQRLARHLKLKLRLVLENSLDGMFEELKEGKGDIIAYSLTVTKKRQERMLFTEPLFMTRQVLVQRKPEEFRQMKLHEIEEHLIRNPIDLIGKKIYVLANSSHYERLLNLSEEIGGNIDIQIVGGDTTTEMLIQQVSEGHIDFTVADKHIAMINQAYFRNIDVRTPLSLPQQIAWAVRKTSPELLDTLNSWIRAMKDSTSYYVIYNKYFENRRAFLRRVKSDYLSVTGGRISPYDDFIKEQADTLGWDWRLLASMIFQESQFRSGVKSWSGATGLMQLLPRTGRRFGVSNLYDPFQNIRAGTNYLLWLNDYWKEEIADSVVRIKFILSSYNVGIGHLQDARRLAEKYGRNPNAWKDNVAYFLLRLSEKKYYDDKMVQFGYCGGIEPFNYVNEILERYRLYKEIIAA